MNNIFSYTNRTTGEQCNIAMDKATVQAIKIPDDKVTTPSSKDSLTVEYSFDRIHIHDIDFILMLAKVKTPYDEMLEKTTINFADFINAMIENNDGEIPLHKDCSIIEAKLNLAKNLAKRFDDVTGFNRAILKMDGETYSFSENFTQRINPYLSGVDLIITSIKDFSNKKLIPSNFTYVNESFVEAPTLTTDYVKDLMFDIVYALEFLKETEV